MQNTAVQAGSADVSVIVRAFVASTGLPKTDITHATSGLEIRTKRGATGAVTTVAPATQTSTGAHSDGGIVHLHGGAYRVDLPDAAVADGAPFVVVTLAGVSDTVFTGATLDLVGSDPRAAALDVGEIRDDAIDLIADIVNGPDALTFKNSAAAEVEIPVTRAARQAIATTTPPE
jgi:hypothetical protein